MPLTDVWKRLGPKEFCLDKTFDDIKSAKKFVQDLNVWNLRRKYGQQDEFFEHAFCFSDHSSLIHERMYFLGIPPSKAYSNKSS
jgi:hypothetical protein